MTSAIHTTNDYVSFGLGNGKFAIELNVVRELVGGQTVTRFDSPSPFVRGWVQLRGRRFVVVDLRCALGLSPAPVTRSATILMVRPTSGVSQAPIGVLVDEVFGLVRIGDVEVARGPYRRDQPFVATIVKRETGEIVVLDPTQLVSDEQCAEVDDLSWRLSASGEQLESRTVISKENLGCTIWSNS